MTHSLAVIFQYYFLAMIAPVGYFVLFSLIKKAI